MVPWGWVLGRALLLAHRWLPSVRFLTWPLVCGDRERAWVSLPLLLGTLVPSDQGLTLTNSSNFNHLPKGCISKYIHIGRCSGLQHMELGRQSSARYSREDVLTQNRGVRSCDHQGRSSRDSEARKPPTRSQKACTRPSQTGQVQDRLDCLQTGGQSRGRRELGVRAHKRADP